MLVFEGTHGTCFSRAQTIRRTGFKLGPGRGGSGAYFWKRGYHSEYLAEAWYLFRISKGDYRNDGDQNGAVISVKLTVRKSEHLDMANQTLKDRLAVLAEKRKVGETVNAISNLYDLFIAELELELQTVFKVIELQVAAPPLEFCSKYPIRILGQPQCLAARDASCISVTSVKRM